MLGQKRYKNIIWIFIILFVVFSVTALSFFTQKDNELTNIHEKIVELYFNNAVEGKLRAEERVIQADTKNELLYSVLNELKAGSKIEGNKIAVPQDVKILYAVVEEDIAIIDLSNDYHHLTLGEKIMCRCAIVWSVTSLDFINYVHMTVEGKEVKKTSGEAIGLMGRENTLINPTISPESKRYEIVSLYFTDKTGKKLVKEEREIEISQIQTREKSVMEQLIIGAKEQGHVSIIPSDIKIRDVTTTKEGICYVDLSSDSINKIINGNINEQIAIYSIVNSMVSLYNVEKVQFLIEGKKIEETMGHLDYTKPFEGIDI
ncbi:GerMN domain-containing protein [Lachnospiraceae bacterium 46-61]